MKNKHEAFDLIQMQGLSLQSKVNMTNLRIDEWYNTWIKYEIFNEETKTTRFYTMDTKPEESFIYTIRKNKRNSKLVTDDQTIEKLGVDVIKKIPFLAENEYVVSSKNGQVYVSRSGGKDSDVLGDLVLKRHPDVPQIFINAGLEDSSVRIHGTEIASNVLYPEKNVVQVITEYGYPIISKEIAKKIYDLRIARKKGTRSYAEDQFNGTYKSKNGKTNMVDVTKYKYLLDAPFRISHLCCDFSKKLPAKKYEAETGRKPFVGTLAEESMLRYSKWIKYGCNAFEQERPTSQPLSFWTEQDILQYIKIHELPIADAYGDVLYSDEDGFLYESPFITDGLKLKTSKADRTGCVYCMFGIAYDTDRFIRLKNNDLPKYNFAMNGGKFDEKGYWVPSKEGLGLKFVIDWLNENGNLNIKY